MSDTSLPTPQRAMGWIPSYPSILDLDVESDVVPARAIRAGQTDSIRSMLEETSVLKAPPSLPATTDLRAWCSPIEDQGALGSCTANAGVGIVEYFEKRAFGTHLDASRLFLYKTTRNLLHWTGDTGAYLRSTMGAMVLFGLPPEEYWKYNINDFEDEPPAFCYAFAQNYQSICYYRLDPIGTPPDSLLKRIKTNLAAGLPSMFGFTCYSSLNQANDDGKIPFPTSSESVVGGHAIVAIGYDDKLAIKNTNSGGIETKGALLIRNSWGAGWGMNGYGWLPYEYVLRGLAVDWWSLLKNEWINTGHFGL